MGIVVVPTFGADPVTVTGPLLDAKVAGLATEFNGSIENANIKAGAAIANSKLNLSSIAQDVTLAGTNILSGLNTLSGITTMSSKILKLAKGADVASTAGTITLGDDGNYFDISGTAAITSITAKTAGTKVVLQFDSTASLVDGSNLKLAGNFTGAAESQICLISDGTNWFEVSRSPNSFTPSTTNALSGSVLQSLSSVTTAVITGTALIPQDDTTPLQASSEGFEVTTQAITPSNASNLIEISGTVMLSPSGSSTVSICIYQDSTSAAIAAMGSTSIQAGEIGVINIYHKMTAGTTSATTFKLWAGQKDAGTCTVNGVGAARLYGAITKSSLNVKEIKA